MFVTFHRAHRFQDLLLSEFIVRVEKGEVGELVDRWSFVFVVRNPVEVATGVEFMVAFDRLRAVATTAG